MNDVLLNAVIVTAGVLAMVVAQHIRQAFVDRDMGYDRTGQK